MLAHLKSFKWRVVTNSTKRNRCKIEYMLMKTVQLELMVTHLRLFVLPRKAILITWVAA